MKFLFFVCLIVLVTGFAAAQSGYLDSLHLKVNNAKEDTGKVSTLFELAFYYCYNQFDSSISYAEQTINLSQKLDYSYGHFLGLRILFFAYNCQGNYPKALEATLQIFDIEEKIKKEKSYVLASIHYQLGVLNREMGNFPIAVIELKEAIRHWIAGYKVEASVFPAFSHLALTYQKLNRPDSALWYAQKGYDLSLQSNMWIRFLCLSSAVLGEVHIDLGNHKLAEKYFSIGVQQSRMYDNYYFLARNYNNLSNLFYKTGNLDSCTYYARLSLQLCQYHNFSEYALNASTLLTKVYELQNKTDSTFKYMKIMLSAKDSLFSQSKVQEFQKSIFDEEQRKQERANAQEKYKNRIKAYVVLAAMIALLLITLIILRNISLKRKNEAHRRAIAENQLQLQKLESERTTAEIQKQAAELEMQALRAQMNPHFIFNSLNSINMFILENNKLEASEYLSKFSRLIRLILQNSQEGYITLDRELEALRLYLELESLRFEQRFEYKISVNDEMDTTVVKVPPLIIQPYAENAIWHGLMHKKEKGHLEIEIYLKKNTLFCRIADDGIGRAKAMELKSKSALNYKSMGMRITADRIAILQQQEQNNTLISVNDLVFPDGRPAGTEVLIKIPPGND